MKKAILVCLIIAGFMFTGCDSPADSGGDVDIPDDRFVGKWIRSSSDNDSLLEFIDSSHLSWYNGGYGWTATGTYTFTDTVISMEVSGERDGETLFSRSLNYRYLLTDEYLDIMSYPGAVPVDPIGLMYRYIRQ